MVMKSLMIYEPLLIKSLHILKEWCPISQLPRHKWEFLWIGITTQWDKNSAIKIVYIIVVCLIISKAKNQCFFLIFFSLHRPHLSLRANNMAPLKCELIFRILTHCGQVRLFMNRHYAEWWWLKIYKMIFVFS